MQQNTSEKKIATVRRMLIEQIFELRGPGPFGRICTPITGCFHDKQKSLRKIFDWIVICTSLTSFVVDSWEVRTTSAGS